MAMVCICLCVFTSACLNNSSAPVHSVQKTPLARGGRQSGTPTQGLVLLLPLRNSIPVHHFTLLWDQRLMAR